MSSNDFENSVSQEFTAEENTDPTENNDSEEAYKKPAVWKDILDFFVWMVIVFICCLLFIKFIAVRSVVDGSSMNPTLQNHDNLIVQKVSYYFHEVERYDIVVFELADEPGVHYIKRVVGLPGETVEVKEDGYAYVNGEKLTDDPVSDDRMTYIGEFSKVTLGENEYYVLGDNRNNSRDSRAIGAVKKYQIIGKTWVRFWPLSAIGIVK